IEFNPLKVQAYRLIGYENRMLSAEDFNDDKKDAGELGSGHTVTALYEVIPAGVKDTFIKSVDPLKYQFNNGEIADESSPEIMTIKLRYKEPAGETSKLIQHPLIDSHLPLANTSENFRFSASVAEFGLLLRNSEYKQQSSFSQVVSLAKGARDKDVNGYRSEFVKLVESATSIV